MARAQIGNVMGVAAKDPGAVFAEITADGANTVTVSTTDARKFRPGMLIDLLTKSDGTVIGASRTVDSINNVTGVITYSGADVATVPGTTAVYQTGSYQTAPSGAYARRAYGNTNGGGAAGSGFNMGTTDTIDDMRARLKAISGTSYSDARLDLMTYNDMVYALRVHDAAGSLK